MFVPNPVPFIYITAFNTGEAEIGDIENIFNAIGEEI